MILHDIAKNQRAYGLFVPDPSVVIPAVREQKELPVERSTCETFLGRAAPTPMIGLRPDAPVRRFWLK